MINLEKYNVIDYHKLLTLKYKEIGLNENEVTVLQLIMIMDYKNIITPKLLAKYMSIDEKEIGSILVKLMEKKYVLLYQNHFDFTPLHQMLLEDSFSVEMGSSIDEGLDNIIAKFTKELGKLLSPIEIETIRGWRDTGVSDELIYEALKTAILSQAYSLRYIDKVIYNWRQRNICTLDDLERVGRM